MEGSDRIGILSHPVHLIMKTELHGVWFLCKNYDDRGPSK